MLLFMHARGRICLSLSKSFCFCPCFRPSCHSEGLCILAACIGFPMAFPSFSVSMTRSIFYTNQKNDSPISISRTALHVGPFAILYFVYFQGNVRTRCYISKVGSSSATTFRSEWSTLAHTHGSKKQKKMKNHAAKTQKTREQHTSLDFFLTHHSQLDFHFIPIQEP